jgi:hypothetical protein
MPKQRRQHYLTYTATRLQGFKDITANGDVYKTDITYWTSSVFLRVFYSAASMQAILRWME